MTKMKFSNEYKTFEDWLQNFKGSESYKNRIIREHEKYPNASLSQLRGHPSSRKKLVSELKPKPLYKQSWNNLSRNNQLLRAKSLDVLSKVRRGLSLTKASKELHTAPDTVIKHTGAFKKVNGKWTAKSQDRISRVMNIYENGKQIWIEINDSRTASRIGKYNNAVKDFYYQENADVLKTFNQPVKDINGQLHYFEINPDALEKIAESIEETEFYEIYKI